MSRIIPGATTYPPLAERQQTMLDLVPRVDGGPGLLFLMGRELEWMWHAEMVPLIARVAPELGHGPFAPKLKGGFSLYYGLVVSALFFSTSRPTSVALASRAARILRLDDRQILYAAYALFPVLYRNLHRGRMRRAAWMATFIMAIDEGVDEGLRGVPLAERPQSMADALDEARPVPADPCLRLARAVVAACRRSTTDGEDQRQLATLMERMSEWARREASLLAIAGDENGAEHRRFGIELSIDLLAWALRPHASAPERDWMVAVAEFGQIVDDWLDVEKDASEGRLTPVGAGLWDATSAARALDDAEAKLMAMADGCSEPADGAWRRLLQRTLRGQARIIVKTLIDHP